MRPNCLALALMFLLSNAQAAVMCDGAKGLAVRPKCKKSERQVQTADLVGPQGPKGDPGNSGVQGPEGPSVPTTGLVIDAVVRSTAIPPAPLACELSKLIIQNFDAGRVEDPNLELENFDSASGRARLPCASTPPEEPGGTKCQTVPGSVGIAFSVPRSGSYLACVTFTHVLLFDTINEGGHSYFAIVRTTPDAQNVLAQPRTQVISGVRTTAASSDEFYQTHRLCDTFRFPTNDEQVYLHLRYRQLAYPNTAGMHLIPLAPGALDVINGVQIPTGVRWEVYYVGGG